MVRFVTGLAPFIGDPLQRQSPLHGSFLAIQQDINDPSGTPQVLALPPDIIKIHKIQAWNQDTMTAELPKTGWTPTCPGAGSRKLKPHLLRLQNPLLVHPIWLGMHYKMMSPCTSLWNASSVLRMHGLPRPTKSSCHISRTSSAPLRSPITKIPPPWTSDLTHSLKPSHKKPKCGARIGWWLHSQTSIHPQRGTITTQASSPDSVASFTTALSQFASAHGTPATTA